MKKFLIVGIGDFNSSLKNEETGAIILKHIVESYKNGVFSFVENLGHFYEYYESTIFFIPIVGLEDKLIKSAMTALGIIKDDILVIVADSNVPFHKIRIKKKHGNTTELLQNIGKVLGSFDYPKLKFGTYAVTLDDLISEDILTCFFTGIVGDIESAIEIFIQEGIRPAMNVFNGIS